MHINGTAPSAGARIGYARVSRAGQNIEPQADRLLAAGCAKIFADQGVSGRLASRPQWDACLAYLRPGETLVVVRLDRVARSLRNLIDIIGELGKAGVELLVLDQAIDTTTPAGKFMWQMIGAISEFESDLIRERTMDGLTAARARGRNGGRPSRLTPAKRAHAQQLLAAGTHNVTQIAELLGVGRSTLYRQLSPEERMPVNGHTGTLIADTANGTPKAQDGDGSPGRPAITRIWDTPGGGPPR